MRRLAKRSPHAIISTAHIAAVWPTAARRLQGRGEPAAALAVIAFATIVKAVCIMASATNPGSGRLVAPDGLNELTGREKTEPKWLGDGRILDHRQPAL